MDDLKSVTLEYLRELARKHLGPGHSKLNKRELIAQLAEFVPALKKLARLAGIDLPTKARPAPKVAAASTKPTREPRGKEARVADKKEPEPRKASEKKASERKKEPEPRREPEKKAAEKKVAERKKEPTPEPRKEPEKKAAERKKEPEARKEPEPKREPEKKAAAPPRQAAQKAEDLSQSMRPAHVVNFPPRPRQTRSAEEEWAESAEVVDSPELESVFQHAAEPLMEGFFVARLMGERELRRHHLTEEQAPGTSNGSAGLEEDLGELPLDYGNDLAMALARDPHTLFLTWDFSAATLARAREGLEAPRAILRVFDGDRLVRELEFAPESRSFYIHGLPPGRPYRVEAHFIGVGGLSRRLGHSTRPLALPHSGPSRDTSVRFMQMPPPPRVPISEPSPEELAASASPETTVEEREYITWRRVALPGSDEMATVAESRRQRIERQAREGARPPERREYLEVTARPPGSSDQSPARGPARAQEYIEVTARPPGSSEQFPARGPSREGASEQSHWMPPRSGRGR